MAGFLLWLRNAVGIVAVVAGFLRHFGGVQYCMKIHRAQDTRGFSSFPFVVVLISLVFWMRYGILRSETAMLISTTLGLSIYTIYNIFYFCYTQELTRKLTLLAMYALCATVDITMLVLMIVFNDPIYYKDTEFGLGLVCAFFQILVFASPLGGIVEVFKKRSCANLPLHIIVLNAAVSVLWFTFGVLANIVWLRITNSVGMVLCAIQLSLFCYFPT